jgi:hypothetical protein
MSQRLTGKAATGAKASESMPITVPMTSPIAQPVRQMQRGRPRGPI